jgi:hypothetical protein
MSRRPRGRWPGPRWPGARHDAHAFDASGLKELIAGMNAAADLGYTGVGNTPVCGIRT